jgi:hypothetical protein
MRRFALHRNFLMSVTDYAKKNSKAKIYGDRPEKFWN